MKRALLGGVILMGIIYVSKYFLSQELKINKNVSSIYMGNCTWYNPNNGPDILDLSAYNHKHDISGWIMESDVEYRYSPCTNWRHCFLNEPSCISVIDINSNSSDYCTNIAYFEDNNFGHPRWVDNHWVMNYWQITNETWIDTLIHWRCDPNLDHGDFRVGRAELFKGNFSNFWYDFNFYSSSVCYNRTRNITSTTTTTAVPGGDCFWNIGNNILNLTRYRNQTIAALESNNSAVVVAITPCTNGLICGNDQVMAYQYDYINSKCLFLNIILYLIYNYN